MPTWGRIVPRDHMGVHRTCGGAGEIGLAHIGVGLYGSRGVRLGVTGRGCGARLDERLDRLQVRQHVRHLR